MTTALAFRDDLDLTIAGLIEDLGAEDSASHTDLSLDRIRVHAEANDPTIQMGEHSVPVTDTGLTALADALQIPAPYFKRIGERGGIAAQGTLLNLTLDYSPGGAVRAEYTPDVALLGLRDPQALVINPGSLARIASRVLGSDESPVQRLVNTSSMFSFDVHVPYNHDRGVGGDRDALLDVPEEIQGYSWTNNLPLTADARVGDVTAAGLRISLDRKRNLAPSVQPWMMRLACTNGMETTTELTKVDARGMTVEEVLADIEAKAEAAFSAMEHEMAVFYDLRNQEVTNPERRLRAMARERGIPDRSLMRMLDLAPEALGDTATEFDVVNHITNFANRDGIREGGRLILERAGGGIVNDHRVRCHTCNHALL